jgi:hypothetical protein
MADKPVFNCIGVFGRYRGGALIAWSLDSLFPLASPTTFTVQASRSGVGDWEDVGTVVDDYSYTDTNRWIYGKLPRLHYRVTFTQDAVDYESDTVQADGNLSGKDARIAREIVRKEHLRLNLWGVQGWLYKVRQWGVKCPECIDWDTGQVKNSHCTTCYGTGFTGGYFSPVEYHVSEASSSPRRQVTDPARGQVINETKIVRGVNCPWLDTGDFWVDINSDKRYVIQTISELDIRGVTVIFPQIEMRLAPSTDIIYSISRPD